MYIYIYIYIYVHIHVLYLYLNIFKRSLITHYLFNSGEDFVQIMMILGTQIIICKTNEAVLDNQRQTSSATQQVREMDKALTDLNQRCARELDRAQLHKSIRKYIYIYIYIYIHIYVHISSQAPQSPACAKVLRLARHRFHILYIYIYIVIL